ncbi:MAG: NADP-dependent oxidoreductase [Pseudomonadota bacterium]|nr:NADP-dependent oxidoreductase [Pseudomonadota bacterium]
MNLNRKVLLASEIVGIPQEENFCVISDPIPEPGKNEILIKHIYLSLDPYQRSAITGAHMSAEGPLERQNVPSAETVGQVIESNHPDFINGDYVRHFGGWQEYSVSDGTKTYKIDPNKAPLTTYLGILGMPGLTAYASVVKLAKFSAGQSVLVSAATGPVGSMVGQLARQFGGSAYGIAGSDKKCEFAIKELGFVDCINYKQPDYLHNLNQTITDGVDVYHDNVGGQILEDAIGVLKDYGTVVLCGLISHYNKINKLHHFNLVTPILKRAVIKGLIVYDFEDCRQEFFDLVSPWVREGIIRYKEDRVFGIEKTGAHFKRLLSGQNFGKSIVVLDEDYV